MNPSPQPASPHRRRYQRGSLLKRGPRWIGRWMEDELQGPFLALKRVYRSEALGDIDTMSKQEAQRALSLRIAAITPLPRGEVFAELWAKWAVDHERKYKVSTWTMILSMARCHFIPRFGSVPAEKIGAAEINLFIRELIERRYDSCTVRNIVLALKVILESTGREIKGIVLPAESIRTERRALTVEEMKKVIAKINVFDIQACNIVRVAAETGLRIGEILALQWDGINADSISIKGTLYCGQVQEPKTKRGRRTIAISQSLHDMLVHRSHSSPFVFPNRTYSQVLKKIKRGLAECGLTEPGLGFHSFRHGNATLLDSIGAPLRIRMDRLGHSRSDTTLGVYTGAARADESRVAEEIGRALA